MKKLISIMLAIVMILSLAAVTFADTTDPTETTGPVSGTIDNTVGSITINKYNEDNVYSIYQMLELKSFNTEGKGSYSYEIKAGWEGFFKGTGEGDEFVPGEGAAYITIDKDGYVTWKSDVDEKVAAPEFAKKALAYAEANNIAPIAVSDKDNTTNIGETEEGYPTYTFSNLQLGYYLVDSTMGALCGLTTTNPDASINAKNGEPTLYKQVKEDSNGQWGTANNASINQIVEYRVTITVQAGAQNYILHDAMSNGLTFNPDSVKVTYDGDDVEATNYEVKTSGVSHEKCGMDCDFAVVFTAAFCDKLEAGKSLVVTYSATLNNAAIVAGEGNSNEARLEFGEDHFTEKGVVTTKTYAFDLVKTDSQNALLDGAEFVLWHVGESGALEEVSLIKVEKPEGGFYYRPAAAGEAGAITQFAVEGGMIRFEGFDSDDYYFEEKVAPEGYNMLKEKAKFTLPEGNKNAIFNGNVYSSGSGFHITNQSGTMLPETGGLGTILFTVLGGTTALGTGVVLVTKKRMSNIDED